MFGCYNRCKHCWIGHSPNGNLTTDDLRFAAGQFLPFAERLTVYNWYREPDYSDSYKELWNVCNELSDERREHFELISVWHIVRDREYVKWLSSLWLKAALLTLFGGQKKEIFTRQKNAYGEILEAIEILLENRISPRIQVFINKDNIDEPPFVETPIEDLDLERRCRLCGKDFSFFIHQGS